VGVVEHPASDVYVGLLLFDPYCRCAARSAGGLVALEEAVDEAALVWAVRASR